MNQLSSNLICKLRCCVIDDLNSVTIGHCNDVPQSQAYQGLRFLLRIELQRWQRRGEIGRTDGSGVHLILPKAAVSGRIHYIEAMVHIQSQTHIHNEPDICPNNNITLHSHLHPVQANEQPNGKRKQVRLGVFVHSFGN